MKRKEHPNGFNQPFDPLAKKLKSNDTSSSNDELNVQKIEEELLEWEENKEENIQKLREERRKFLEKIETQDHTTSAVETPIMSLSHLTSQTKTMVKDVKKEEEEDEFDMFADEDFKIPTIPHTSNTVITSTATTTINNFDDEEQYYIHKIGEVIHHRYKIQSTPGKGVFSSVVTCLDSKTNEKVAIKIIRNNESMKQTGLKEVEILKRLQEKDLHDKKYIVRYKDHFIYKNHLCIVFEALEMNLRQVLQKFGMNQGISMEGVRLYAKQMFIALKHLQVNQILHADIKPDNILVNETHTISKLSDFGSASDVSENAIAPYLVSRFYRAPEIILGYPYSYPIDMWSIACTLFELYTGTILFPSKNNSDALKWIMEYKSNFPTKVLKSAQFRSRYFDEQGRFLLQEKEAFGNRLIVKPILIKKSRDIKTALIDCLKKQSNPMDEKELKKVLQLSDLLEKALHLDPQKRLTIKEALDHPFLLAA